jgi:uncharacterized membrane protein (UPF0136 family)
MTLATATAIAYGIITFIGGILGYAQAKSKASLISGLITGSLLILCGILQLAGVAAALWGAIAITVLLVAVFAVRLSKTRSLMPSGLMIVLGVAALVIMGQSVG